MRNALNSARNLMRRRKFSEAITLLDSRREHYRRNFDFSLTLGIAYLYIGEAHSAWENLEDARKIKMRDVNLLLAQAALFLKRGDTDRAVQYYLEIQEYEPNNKIAKNALDFLRYTSGDYTTICQWSDSKKLEQFYPPLGINYFFLIKLFAPLVIAAIIFAGVIFAPKIKSILPKKQLPPERVDISSIELSIEEIKNAQTSSNQNYRYELSNKQIADSYSNLLKYFQEYRDNAVIIEINRLENSNAATEIKHKARTILNYVVEPDFNSINKKDIPTYEQVAADPLLYVGCYVIWNGHVSNARTDQNGFKCNLLVGPASMEQIDGIVPLHFDAPQEVKSNFPVTVFAQISLEENQIILYGKSLYQVTSQRVLN